MTELPTTFGKYFLTEKLATGGMAEIYLAKLVGPNGFEKQLVIKQIHPRLTGQRAFVDLFVTEAKTLVALTHGNIVPVYELGVVGDTYFIAMEYIDGPTLYRLTERAHRRGDRLAPPVAAWIAARILEGLDYAHRKGEGLVHRDLSPRNVMLSRDGEVKLVDFGIAVTLGDESTNDDAGQSAPTGSFPYMSPEQVRREPLTPRSDLFSLGVLLWEMLVGERLFARADADATLAAVQTYAIPRPGSRVPEVPAKLDEIVMRALERDPAARWPAASEMLAPLQRYLYALDVTPGPRDVAGLVATYCPPELRRAPTNLDAMQEDAPAVGGPSTVVVPRAPVVPETAVVPRQPRQQTFATHVEIEEMLAPPPTEAARTDRPPDHATEGYRPLELRMPKLGVPGREPPSRATLVIVAFGALALGAGAIVMFFRGRGAMLADDAMIDTRATDARAIDVAITPDAAGPEIDAALAIDAARPMAIDGGPRPTIDAAPAPPRPDASTATAILKIGADPWGEIVVDGVPRGRTPAELTVSIGHHAVEIVYRGEDPPRTKAFPVELVPNQTLRLQADFTKP